jgi:hypothetical protein
MTTSVKVVFCSRVKRTLVTGRLVRWHSAEVYVRRPRAVQSTGLQITARTVRSLGWIAGALAVLRAAWRVRKDVQRERRREIPRGASTFLVWRRGMVIRMVLVQQRTRSGLLTIQLIKFL